MPPTNTNSTAKSNKAAKLKLAREKAKQWALEQQAKKKSGNIGTSKTVKNVVVKEEVFEEDEDVDMNTVITASSVSTTTGKRKRGTEDSDEEEINKDGPNGTPKVPKPRRKKVNATVTPRIKPAVKKKSRPIMTKKQAEMDYSREEFDEDEIVAENTPTMSTTVPTAPKTPSSTNSKKEKLRLAREKAAKWAKEQKYAGSSTTSARKNKSSSISLKSSGSRRSGNKQSLLPSKKTATEESEIEAKPMEEITTPATEPVPIASSPTPAPIVQNTKPYPTPFQTQPVKTTTTPAIHFGQLNIPASSTPVVPMKSRTNSIPVSDVPPISKPVFTSDPPPQQSPITQPLYYSTQTEQQQPVIPKPPNQPSQQQQQWKEAMSTIKESISKAAAEAIEVVDKQERNIPPLTSLSPLQLHSTTPSVTKTSTKPIIVLQEEKEMQVPEQPIMQAKGKEKLSEAEASPKSSFFQRVWKKQDIQEEEEEEEEDEDEYIFQDALEENEVMSEYNQTVSQHMAVPDSAKSIETKPISIKPILVAKEDVEKEETKPVQEIIHMSFLTRIKNFITRALSFMFALLIFFVGIAIVYSIIDNTSSIWSQPLFQNTDPIDTDTFSKPNHDTANILAPPCYTSTVETPDEEYITIPPNLEAKGFTTCRPQTNPIPCPVGGICFGGYLQTCFPGDILQINELNDACELTSQGETVLKMVKNRLITMTVEKTCGCWLNNWLSEDSSCLSKDARMMAVTDQYDESNGLPNPIMFDIETVCKGWDISYRTLSSMNQHFVNHDIVLNQEYSYSSPKISYIGFTPSYLQHKIPIPISCYMSLFMTSLFSFLFKVLYVIMTELFSYLAHSLYYHPIPTLSVVFLLGTLHGLRLKRKRTLTLRQITREVREMAYDKLKLRGDDRYGEQYLRDDIAHELHPDSLKLRKKFMSDIWPRVLVEVRCDSRVKRGYTSGMEWWEWVDRRSSIEKSE